MQPAASVPDSDIKMVNLVASHKKSTDLKTSPGEKEKPTAKKKSTSEAWALDCLDSSTRSAHLRQLANWKWGHENIDTDHLRNRLDREGIRLDNVDSLVLAEVEMWRRGIYGNDEGGTIESSGKRRPDMPIQQSIQSAMERVITGARMRVRITQLQKVLLEALDRLDQAV
ncbi:hypothetical protein OG21DRAFT_1525775 [Imleria badia]|nr:hypothetical protein OG21DRAFT_1525775 [Imleria badia]